jgi:uncharacterized protein YeeX (DUF496 family)
MTDRNGQQFFPTAQLHEIQCLLRMSKNATDTIDAALVYISNISTQRRDIDECVKEAHEKKKYINSARE